MYSRLRNAVGPTRALYNAQQQNSSLPQAMGVSYANVLARRYQSPAARRLYLTYADEGASFSKDNVADEQDVFVRDEQWRDRTGPAQNRFDHAGYYAQESVASVASSSSQPSLNSLYFSQAMNDVGPSMSSRLLEDDRSASVRSWEKYEPESYDSLNALQKKLITEEDYSRFVEEYRNLKDVEIDKFSYMVDGQPVTGYALLPKAAPKNGKHPLVVVFRGGFNGEGAFHEWAKIDLPYIMRHFAFYAQNGYAVLTSQYRGADGNTNKDEFGGGDVRDVLGLFDVAQDMKNIDLNDVSLSAFSRGTVMAYKTLKEIKNQIPVKAVVIKGGISDLNTFVKEDPKYIRPILEQARPDFNECTDKICTDISLVADAQVLKGIPTLVMHNENDNVVPSKLSRNLVVQLQEHGVEHEAHFFPGKHHQILESNDQVKNLTINWLNKQRNKKIKSSL